jgi:hypothetical protein
MRLSAADDDKRGSTCLAELSGLPKLAVPVLCSTVWNHAGLLDCVDGIPARFVALYEHGRIRCTWRRCSISSAAVMLCSPVRCIHDRLPSAPSGSLAAGVAVVSRQSFDGHRQPSLPVTT